MERELSLTKLRLSILAVLPPVPGNGVVKGLGVSAEEVAEAVYDVEEPLWEQVRKVRVELARLMQAGWAIRGGETGYPRFLLPQDKYECVYARWRTQEPVA